MADHERGEGVPTGHIFVACMFLGLGLGLAARRPDVGVLTGMGVGFLAMAFVRVRAEPVELGLPTTARAYFMLIVGATLMVAGLGLIYFPDALYPHLTSAFLILLGLGFIVFGARLAQGSSRQDRN